MGSKSTAPGCTWVGGGGLASPNIGRVPQGLEDWNPPNKGKFRTPLPGRGVGGRGYSLRSASTGSTLLALRAGTYAATSATAPRRSGIPKKVTRSRAPIP